MLTALGGHATEQGGVALEVASRSPGHAGRNVISIAAAVDGMDICVMGGYGLEGGGVARDA